MQFSKPRCVTQTSEKAKVRRSENFKSMFLISAVRTPRNLGSVSGRDWETRAMCPRRLVEIGQKYLIAQRKGQSYIFLTYRGLVSPSTIRNKLEEREFRCSLRSTNAHAEQERPEVSRVGNRKSLQKSDHGCYSQWRSANKRWSNSECQGIGFIRDSEASRRYTWQFSHLENSAKITDIPSSGPVVRNHNSLKMTDEYNATRKTAYRSLSSGLSTGSSSWATLASPASLPQEGVILTLRPASTRSECMSSQAWRDRRQNQQKPKTHMEMRTTKQYGETRCVTCQNG